MLQNKLLELLESNRSAGLFSHYGFTLGFLNEDSPRHRFVSHEDEQVFDLSSLTKALALTPLVLSHVKRMFSSESLEVSVSRSVREVFPNLVASLNQDALKSIETLRVVDLLRHESGLPIWRNFFTECDQSTSPSMLERLSLAVKGPLAVGKNAYSDIGFILLGSLLESHYERRLSDLYEDFLVSFLSAYDEFRHGDFCRFPHPSFFYQPTYCVPTGICPVRQKLLRGDVHDENCFAMGGFTGHAGLFGTVDQVTNLVVGLYTSTATRWMIGENYRFAQKDLKSDSAIGWRTARDAANRVFGEGAAIGHLGFTGTTFWVNPENLSYVVILTNRVASSRLSNMSRMREFRQAILTASQAMIQAR